MTTNATTLPPKVQQAARLRWVPLDQLRINPDAQRVINPSQVDHIAANLDLDRIGCPVVSSRDGRFYVLDGQHRIEALRQVGFTDETIQCWVSEGLMSEDEADVFLKENDILAVPAIAKFLVSVHAGRDIESDIDRMVRSAGCIVSRDHLPGAIQAVGTLRRVYDRDPSSLPRALRIIRDAYGDAGLEAAVIDGMGYLVGRYNGELDDAVAAAKLGKAMGGVSGLLGKAEKMRLATGTAKGQCVAAAAVEIINQGAARGKKLPSWWKVEAS